MEVQTRSDSHTGLYSGSNYFLSVKEAYKAHKMDKNISKLTFDDKEGNHRYKLKLKKSLYNQKSEERLYQLSNTYKNAKSTDLFWVDQSVMADGEWDYRKIQQDEEYSNLHMAACIKNVFSDEEFRNKYNIN